ncbi:MAG: YdcF family protein [Paracoccaceae bacterium]|nr:YdcF family protein [Paracoccaceae bacterium]
MSFIRWILSLTILALWCAFIGTMLYVAMFEPPETTPQAQAVVVLGGNPPENGALVGPSLARLETGVALIEDGAAPYLVVTGGGPQPVAPLMADAAKAAGVAEDAVLVEAQAQSTLQNALLTADFAELDKSQPIIIVTERYHLPRAWASFRWAGFEQVHNVATDADEPFALSTPLLLESVKWPLNILRAGAASVAMAFDVPRESFMNYLE